MASFTAGTTFVDGVANDVTAAKLGTLVTNATPTSGFIQDRTAETVVATNDTLLIGDASDSNTLKRMTVANVMKAEHTGTINTTAGTIQTLTSSTATITTGTVATLNSTTGTITGLNSTTGTVATLNSTTGTIAGLSSTNGTIANLNSTTGTVATLNSTTGTITTGVIPTLTSITKITSGTGTAAAPAISPTGDTNTGIFFPAADTIAFSEGGAEAMRIDSSGNVGIGTTSPSQKLTVASEDTLGGILVTGSNAPAIRLNDTTDGSTYSAIFAQNNGVLVIDADASNTAANSYLGLNVDSTERLRINSSGNVGIGTTSPTAQVTISKVVNSATLPSTSANHSISLYPPTTTGYYGGGISWAEGANTSANICAVDDGASGALGLVLSTGNNSAITERLRIDSSGNVGVGTDNPGARLSVDSSTISRYAVFNSTSTNGGYLEFRSIGTVQGDIGTASQVVSGSTSDFAVNARGARNLVLGTNNTERLRIDSSGNVSIGTATALSKLHVHGDLTMSNATTAVTASTSTITPPATVAGYLTVSINGTSRKIAYYAT